MGRRQAGFTLVEVVVAFVLLAAVLGIVIEIFSTGMARAADMEHYSRALVIAQTKLASAGIDQPLAEGETSGESDDRQYRWVLAVRRSEEGEAGTPSAQLTGRPMAGGYTLYRLDARVTWAGPLGAERSVKLATLQIAQNK